MIELDMDTNENKTRACLKVLGVGGAGGNAVSSMINSEELDAVQFIVANTDLQALNMSPAEHKIQLGAKITKGLGAGSNPEVGKRAAEEDLEAIIEQIADSDILFLTAGLGGGTGSGALPIISKVAKEKGILTIAIVSTPFLFEGKRRWGYANGAVKDLKESVDTLIVVPNQRLLEIVDPKISMLDAFAKANEILKQAIKGISDIITKSGHINVDFADVFTIMKDMGMAMMGTGCATGEGRAKQAAIKAISSPLLEDVSIKGAKGVLLNISGNSDLGLHEINEAAQVIYNLVSEDANIILGSVIDPDIGDEIKVTVIATGLENEIEKAKEPNVYPDNKQEELVSSSQVASEIIFEDKEEKKTEEVEVLKENSKVEKTKGEVFVSPGVAGDLFDLNDMDSPAFLRKDIEKEKTESK